MIIEFDAKSHCYSVNGDIASISVTELLGKHNLAPNYSGVSKAKMKESAEKGKAVHEDLEYVLNKEKYEPTTPQGTNFQEWVKEHLDCGVGEQMLAYDYNGMIIAGTADVMAIGKNGAYILGDHKNTATKNKEYVSWQVSLLDYFARKLGKEKVNGKVLNWKGATEFYCFHYDKKSGDMEVLELDKVPDTEIERLLDAEYNEDIYQRPVLVIDRAEQLMIEQAELLLIEKEKEFKQAKAQVEQFREQLCKCFEEQGIKSWESPNGLIQITYVAPTESISVDSAKLKKEYPQIYSSCTKLSKKKAYVRVTNRLGDDD